MLKLVWAEDAKGEKQEQWKLHKEHVEVSRGRSAKLLLLVIILGPHVCLHTYIWVGEAEKGFPWHCSLWRLVCCRDQPYLKEAQFNETRRRVLPLECINRTVPGTTPSLRRHKPGQKRFELRVSQNTVKLPGQPAGYKGKTDPGPSFHRTWQPPEVKHSSLLSLSLHFFLYVFLALTPDLGMALC